MRTVTKVAVTVRFWTAVASLIRVPHLSLYGTTVFRVEKLRRRTETRNTEHAIITVVGSTRYCRVLLLNRSQDEAQSSLRLKPDQLFLVT